MRARKINLQNKPRRLHVVAAVIENQHGQIFIARRPNHVHQGGFWEFPGGKVETSETALQAIKRELFEEMGIHTQNPQPLIQIAHDYPDKLVFLDVWHVTAYSGKAHGKEGQQTQWVNKSELNQLSFPAANKAIISAAMLPRQYLITPEPDLKQLNGFLEKLAYALESGIRLFQLRAKTLDETQLERLFQEITRINQSYNANFLINSSVEFAKKIGANGVHLSSLALNTTKKLPDNMLCAASCHSNEEIITASNLGVDFIVLSPVLKTNSHPNSNPLSWENFSTLCKSSTTPVFALGGMKMEHLPLAINSGAQGIAGIRAFWGK